MSFSIKIPAKCILAGEHVILERGFAVVSPFDHYDLTLSYKPGSMKTMYTISAEGYNSLGIILWPVVTKAYELLGQDVSKLTGEFDIQSSIPPGGGLGFSAALCVAVTEWLIYSGLIPRSRLFDFALELEHIFHFRSSGVDVAGVLSKNIIQYTSNREITVINPSWKPKLFVSSSKEMAITGSCVKKVMEFRKTNPERAKEIDDKMSSSTQLIKSALEAPEPEGIALLAQGLHLGNECFHDWELVSPQLAHHLDEVSQYAMACKVIGAGFGGHVLSLWEHNPPNNLPFKLHPLFK
jgi:mevalonate kinase